jgi:HEAT repeat protein
MADIPSLIQRVEKTQHGFTDILRAADEVFASQTAAETLATARELYTSDVPQARMLATYLFGKLAAGSKDSLAFLREHVSRDPNWRVQEILAQAFDQFCGDTGYEAVLPVITDWLGDPNPNVRRAVTEGLRIWTGRPYFREHPQTAIRLLSQFKADASEYVRKSVGNALRDISRQHADLVRAELQGWDIADRHIRQTHKLASRFLA